MVDQRIEKLAELCVHYSVEVKTEEKVLIRGSARAVKNKGQIKPFRLKQVVLYFSMKD